MRLPTGGGNFFWRGLSWEGGAENVFNLVPPGKRGDFLQTKKSTFLCKIFTCGALLDSGFFSKFLPAAAFNDLFSLYTLTLKVY